MKAKHITVVLLQQTPKTPPAGLLAEMPQPQPAKWGTAKWGTSTWAATDETAAKQAESVRAS